MTAAANLTSLNWREFDTPGLPVLLQSSLDCFVAHGYHGTSIRNLAAAARLSVPGLYYHYASKQEILVTLMGTAMADLYARSNAALAEAGGSALTQLRLHVECLVLFHAHRGDLAFVAASEIRSLGSDARAQHIAARDRQQRILEGIVDRGVEAGAFDVEFPKEASLAIVTMCTGVAQWYRLGGPLSPEELAGRYETIAVSALRG
jgi:AcrR family transcriptional regulator